MKHPVDHIDDDFEQFPVKEEENYEQNLSPLKEEIKEIEKEKKDTIAKQKSNDKENNESKVVKALLNASDLTKFQENGLWKCHICPNTKYLFVFELFDHWREIHPKDFVVGIGTKLEDKLFEICEKYSESTFDRDLLLFQDGYWICPLCQNQDRFEHKCQLVSHWFENHSNAELTYEACQWCMELFTSPKHSEQVILF